MIILSVSKVKLAMLAVSDCNVVEVSRQIMIKPLALGSVITKIHFRCLPLVGMAGKLEGDLLGERVDEIKHFIPEGGC